MGNVDKLKARKQALLDRLRELEQKEKQAVSAEMQARRKADDRTKLLLGIAAMAYIKDTPAAGAEIARFAERLSPSDRRFLATSALWKELGLPTPPQATESPQEAPTTAKPQAAARPAEQVSAEQIGVRGAMEQPTDLSPGKGKPEVVSHAPARR